MIIIFPCGPARFTRLSHDEQIERVRVVIEQLGAQISRVVNHADELTVTSAWNMTMTKHNRKKMCVIEVFRVENGRLTHYWNTAQAEGPLGFVAPRAAASRMAGST
jgi:hypothetical protein